MAYLSIEELASMQPSELAATGAHRSYAGGSTPSDGGNGSEKGTITGRALVFSPTEHRHLTPYLAVLYRRVYPRIPLLDYKELLTLWKKHTDEIELKRRMILVLVNESQPNTKVREDELVGMVSLSMPPPHIASHRGTIETLEISDRFDWDDGASILLSKLEGEALRLGRTLLVSQGSSSSWTGIGLFFFLLTYSPARLPRDGKPYPAGVSEAQFQIRGRDPGLPYQPQRGSEERVLLLQAAL